VSHELKTPITSIKGFSQTLLDGALDNPEDAQRFLAIIDKQTSRLQAIIEDLLALSRIEHDAEQGGLEMQETAADRIVENGAAAWRGAAHEKGVQLDVQHAPDLMVRVNSQLMERALGNLIDNAIKYSATGSTVRVWPEAHGQEIALRVCDQGPGIPRTHHERLFERFYRVDKSRSRSLGGTGLGLAIVKQVAIAHRGRVAVESEPGKGSTFTIFLPAA
jgi:two-component system phosphate regulon sensor histidine kinase PhoR